MDPGQMERGVFPSVFSTTQAAESSGSPKPAHLTPVPRFHCPFLQNDLDTYRQCGSCDGDGFDGLSRVKEHIKRHHVRPLSPAEIHDLKHRDDKLKRRVEKLHEQKVMEKLKRTEQEEGRKRKNLEKENEKNERKNEVTMADKEESETGKQHGCPKTLSPLQFYELFGKQEQSATRDSPRQAWLKIYQSLFPDDKRRPPAPFKPHMDQFKYLLRHRTPQFLAWCEEHHAKDCSVNAMLDSCMKIVEQLGETGGFLSDPATPSTPSYSTGLPEWSRSPAHLERPGHTQPRHEDTNTHDGDLAMDEVYMTYMYDDNMGISPDMPTIVRNPSPSACSMSSPIMEWNT